MNLRKILNDEDKSRDIDEDRKTFGVNLLEGAINLVRFELLCPKIEKLYDFGGMTGDWPKGFGSAVVANAIAGAYIGSHYGERGSLGGAFASLPITILQGIIGYGVRGHAQKSHDK